MATTKKAAPKKPAAKKAAPKAEPTAVEAVELTSGDAHAVLSLDGKKFRLEGEAVAFLRRAFERVHSIVNPGH